MSDFLTPNYQFNEPEVGGSSGTWGDKLDSNLGLMDRLLGLTKPIVALSNDGALDLSEALVHRVTAAGDISFVISNTPVAESGGNPVSTFVWLYITNGGLHTLTWPGSVTWLNNDVVPTLRNSGTDVIMLLTVNEGASWVGAHVGTVDDASIFTSQIVNGAVTTPKLAADAVTNAKLADNAVQNENILDGTIAQAKLAFSVQSSPELPVHVSQAFYDGSNAAVQGILNVLVSVGLIEVS